MNIRVEIINQLKNLKKDGVYRVSASELTHILDSYSLDQLDFALRNMVRSKVIDREKCLGIMLYSIREKNVKTNKPKANPKQTKVKPKQAKAKENPNKVKTKPITHDDIEKISGNTAKHEVKPKKMEKEIKQDEAPSQCNTDGLNDDDCSIRKAIRVIEAALLNRVGINDIELKIDTLNDIAEMFNEKVSPILIEIANDLRRASKG